MTAADFPRSVLALLLTASLLASPPSAAAPEPPVGASVPSMDTSDAPLRLLQPSSETESAAQRGSCNDGARFTRFGVD